MVSFSSSENYRVEAEDRGCSPMTWIIQNGEGNVFPSFFHVYLLSQTVWLLISGTPKRAAEWKWSVYVPLRGHPTWGPGLWDTQLYCSTETFSHKMAPAHEFRGEANVLGVIVTPNSQTTYFLLHENLVEFSPTSHRFLCFQFNATTTQTSVHKHAQNGA